MDDSAALAGVWQIVKAELAGDEMPAFVAEKIEVELGVDDYVVRFDGQISDCGTYTLGASAEARTILLSGREGTNAGRTIPAIYQLAGNRLRICYGLDGLLPTAFATSASDKLYLVTYRRRVGRAAT